MPVPVRKAIFPVAGFGTRLLPATRCLPKEMIPVVDKPLIQYVFEEARAAGIEEFIFVTARGKSVIEDHFDHAHELEAALTANGRHEALALVRSSMALPGQIICIRQPEPLGLGHAIWCARNLVGREPVAVLLADDLVLSDIGCLSQMVEAYAATGGNMAAVMNVAADEVSAYGIVAPGNVRGHLVEIRDLVEKPPVADAPSTIAMIGRYIIQPEVFDDLARFEKGAGGEIQLTDALARQIGQHPVNGYLFNGQRFDCGNRAGLLEANIAFALARTDLRDTASKLLRSYA